MIKSLKFFSFSLLMILLALPAKQVISQETEDSSFPVGDIQGTLMINGEKPMSGGIVSFFDIQTGPPPNYGNARRIPDMVTFVEPNGNFTVRLGAGEYYLGAMERNMSEGPGPPRPGDKLYFAMTKDKAMRTIKVIKNKLTDLKYVMIAAPGSFKELDQYFTVTGTVVDENDKPFQGALIMFKQKLDSPRPDLISNYTGVDGKYSIKLPAGKSYYLIAKDQLMPGRPRTGNRLGVYIGPIPDKKVLIDESPPAVPVTGKDKEVLTGIDILLYKIPEPESFKEQRQKENKEKGVTNKKEDSKKDRPGFFEKPPVN